MTAEQRLVAYRTPYEPGAVLGHLARRVIPGVEVVDADGYRRVLVGADGPTIVEVQDAGDGTHLTVRPGDDDVIRAASDLFSVEVDVVAALTALSTDPVLGPLVTARPGVRVAGSWDRFETAVRIIVGQQVSVAGATTLTGRIVAACGAPVDVGDDALTHLFPTPSALAAADLSGLGMPVSRTRALGAFAAAVADGRLDLASSPTPDASGLDGLVTALVALPGIGPWTAQLVAARVYGHPDAFAASDIGLQRAVATLTGRTTRPAPAELESLAERWRPWRSLAAQHLWLADATATGRPAG